MAEVNNPTAPYVSSFFICFTFHVHDWPLPGPSSCFSRPLPTLQSRLSTTGKKRFDFSPEYGGRR
jgi:hypothetical protein